MYVGHTTCVYDLFLKHVSCLLFLQSGTANFTVHVSNSRVFFNIVKLTYVLLCFLVLAVLSTLHCACVNVNVYLFCSDGSA